MRPGHLERLADGVYAYVQPSGGWCVNNAGVLLGDDGVLLIDTVATERRAAALRNAAEGLGAGPVRIVVNTHFHGDHTFGNGLVGERVAILARANTRRAMAATGTAMTGLWPRVEWGRVDPALPDLTFDDRVTLHVGRRVELIPVETAHTDGDVVCWLPAERILFTGDVAFHGVCPFVLMGSVAGSLRVLARLRRLRPRVVVCGHGPVGGPEVLEATEAYLRWLRRVAEQGIRAGHGPLECARRADPGEFAGLTDGERLVANLHRAYVEAAAAPPPDVLAVQRDMATLRGSPLISHA